MRIGLATWGSEGDIRPFLGLAEGLALSGHQVSLVYTSVEQRDYSPLSARCGFEMKSVGHDLLKKNRDTVMERLEHVLRHGNPLEQIRGVGRELYDPVVDEMYKAALELAEKSDLIIFHFLHHAALTAALKCGCKAVSLSPAPSLPSRYYAPLGAPDLGRLFYPFLWRTAEKIADSIFVDRVNKLRIEANVPPMKGLYTDPFKETAQMLVSVSPGLFPRPADWDDRVQLCGFINLTPNAESWKPDEELNQFIDGSLPPLFATFGSMLSFDRGFAIESLNLITEAIEMAGERAILQMPESILPEFKKSKSIFPIGRVPHSVLFPRCAAIIHHGGAGSTQAAVLSGRPSIVVSHVIDQFFWGAVLSRKGVAPQFLKRTKATSKKLASLITKVLNDPAMNQRATLLGKETEKENGVVRAVQLIEQIGEQKR